MKLKSTVNPANYDRPSRQSTPDWSRCEDRIGDGTRSAVQPQSRSSRSTRDNNQLKGCTKIFIFCSNIIKLNGRMATMYLTPHSVSKNRAGGASSSGSNLGFVSNQGFGSRSGGISGSNSNLGFGSLSDGIGGSHLQIDSGLRGQVLGAIGFPLRLSWVSLVKDSSGLMSLISLLWRLSWVSLVKDSSGLMSLISLLWRLSWVRLVKDASGLMLLILLFQSLSSGQVSQGC